ncbi:hypothetical protein QCA50_001841 [Cerrena zonata]|uniref:methylated diphthine methylhydrolase n=1 Tax=Cerrena zonata TaxID=2478898 RepID=A0AAW0GUA5_9APHY
MRLDTIDPADTVEFCPHPNASNLLVCGTYKLVDANAGITEDDQLAERAPQKRIGSVLAFEIQENDELSQIQEISLPAVPDIKWAISASPVLGVADSEGNISLHIFDLDEKRFSTLQSLAVASSDVLSLSLDWSNRRNPSSGLGSLVVSLSNGSLSHLLPGESGMVIDNVWHAHDFEPWIAAWNYWDENIIYSGGDDLKMKSWDVRIGFGQPVFTNKRFDAGVTTIQSHPYIEHLMAVGSYDNTIRLFDARKPLVPLTQLDVGGGAWRVKWHPSEKRKNDLLVACMHDGCKIIRFDVEGENIADGGTVIQRFDEHKSMAYGADWSYAEEDTNRNTLVASCSFYDHVLYTWRG